MQAERAVGTVAASPSTNELRFRAFVEIQRVLQNHGDDEIETLDQFCRILAHDREYMAVFIGAAQPDGSVEVYSSYCDPGLQSAVLQSRWDATPFGAGAVGQAIRSGYAVRLDGDSPERAAWRSFPAAVPARAVAAFPFHLDDTLGAVGLLSRDPAAFDDAEMIFLQGATDFVTTTLESTRFRKMIFAERDRARRSESRLAALWSLAVASGFELDAQAEAIISEGSRTLGFEFGAIGHVEGEVFIVDFVASLQPRGRRFYPLDVTLSSEAIARGRTFACSDLTKDPRYVMSTAVVENRLRAFTATPFSVGGRTYILSFGAFSPLARRIGPDDLSYIDLLASFFTRALRQRDDEMKIRYLQSHDAVTGLLNRERFHERLDEMVERSLNTADRFALFNIDLDRFRETIESVGVVTSDEVIGELARRLTRLMRSGQELFRGSSDSFTVLVPGFESPEAADRLGREIMAAIAAPFYTDRAQFALTASLGMAIFPEDGRSGQELLSAATAAMQRAKSGGSADLRFFGTELDERLSRRRQFIRELGGAAERGELVLHYQPWIDLRTNAVAGAEALVRWRHPSRGLIMPDDFIGLAEESDAIFALGNWVFTQAAHFSALCAERNIPLTISINLSARQLGDPALVETIRSAVARASIDPRTLELEVTETFGVQDPEAGRSLLEELRRLGLRIALDDFGIGHSSLSMLKHLPVDIMKIDRAFVRGLPSAQSDAAIARAILALAQSISIETRAEGVENAEQAAWLAAAGCQTAQGFWIARPLGPMSLLTWIAEHTRS